MSETPVLIVGGGPAGLVAGGFLAINGVKCIVLEKHEQISLHPRAVGFTTRTMEIFDTLGVVDKIPQMSADFKLRRIQVESLAGEWGDEIGPPGGQGVGKKPSQPNMLEFSPYFGAAIAQDKLDVILRQRLEELNVDVRYGHRMLSFTQTQDSKDLISVQIRDPSGKEYMVTAKYLLGADGHKSPIRESLDIRMSGRGHISTLQSVLFRAPSLNKYLDRGFHQFQIKQPQNDLFGFLTTYNDGRWVLMGQDEKIRSEKELGEAILNATGVPDLEYEFVTTGLWNLSGRVADSFSFPIDSATPNIFLLGDAAHTLPPTRGGYGANTGISDAHNMAWKLASVLSGRSRPDLLKSYNTERRAVAWLRHQQTFAGPDYARYRREGDDYGSVKDSIAMELGQVYQSHVIMDYTNIEEVQEHEPVALRPDQLRGLPGSRAPHVWLKTNTGKISTLKVFENRWTLVTTNKEWLSCAITASNRVGFELQTLCPGFNGFEEEQKGELAEKFGFSDGNASLVRPDGIVSWRSRAWKDNTIGTETLVDALKQSGDLA